MADFDYSRYMTHRRIRRITKRQLAQRLDVSESTVYRWIRNGKLPQPEYSTSGYCLGWLESTIDTWVSERSIPKFSIK